LRMKRTIVGWATVALALLGISPVVLLAAGCAKKNAPGGKIIIRPIERTIAAARYLPLEKTQTLVYRETGGALETHTFAYDAKRAQAELIILRSRSYRSRLHYRREGGYVVASVAYRGKTIQARVLKEVVRPGESWDNLRGHTMKVIGAETVRVPWGTFRDCLVVARFSTDDEGKKVEVGRHYYALGLGQVREVAGESDSQLVRRIPGKKLEIAPRSAEEAVLLVKHRFPGMQGIRHVPGMGFSKGGGATSDADVLTERPRYEVVIWQGWGDPPAGCIYNRYTYFTVSREGRVEKAGFYGDPLPKDDDDSGGNLGRKQEGRPLWGVPCMAKDEKTADPARLAAYLSSAKWWLRKYALQQLRKGGKVRHREEYLRLRGDSHPRVRMAAADALAALGGDGNLRELLPQLKDANVCVARNAIQHMDKAKAPDILARLVPFLKDPKANRGVVSQAIVALCIARYKPALPLINKLLLKHSDFSEKGARHFSNRLYYLAAWAQPTSVPVFLHVLGLRDEEYESAVLKNRNPNVSYFSGRCLLQDTALDGLERISGRDMDFFSFSLHPEDRLRLLRYWTAWWQKQRSVLLGGRRKALSLAEIREVLDDPRDPRHKHAIADLHAACKSGRARVTDFAEQVLHLGMEYSDGHSRELVRELWLSGGKEAIARLEKIVGGEHEGRARKAIVILRKLRTAPAAAAILRTGNPNQVLTDAKEIYSHGIAAATDKKPAQRKELRTLYHRLILRGLEHSHQHLVPTAMELAKAEKVEGSNLVLRARADLARRDQQGFAATLRKAAGKKAGTPLSAEELKALPSARLREHWRRLVALKAREARLKELRAHEQLEVRFERVMLGVGPSWESGELKKLVVDLGRRKSPHLLPLLKTMLASEEFGLRLLALQVMLRRYDHVPAPRELVAAFRGGVHYQLGHYILEAAKRSPDRKAMISELQAFLADPNTRDDAFLLAIKVAKSLDVSPAPAVWQRVFRIASDSDTRKPATELAVRHCSAAFAAFLVRRARTARGHEWAGVMRQLAKCDSDSLRKETERELDALFEERRADAAKIAGEFKLSTLIPALQKSVTETRCQSVRGWAMVSLVAMAAPEHEKFFLKLVDDPFVQLKAVKGLLAIDYEKHRAQLLRLLASPTADHQRVVKAFAARKDPRALPTLHAYFRAGVFKGKALDEWARLNRSSSLRGRVSAGTTISRKGTVGSAVSSIPVYHALKAALDLMVDMDYQQVVPDLQRMLKEGKWGYQSAALDALLRMARGEQRKSVVEDAMSWAVRSGYFRDTFSKYVARASREDSDDWLLRFLAQADDKQFAKLLDHICYLQKTKRGGDMLRLLAGRKLAKSPVFRVLHMLKSAEVAPPAGEALAFARKCSEDRNRLTVLQCISDPKALGQMKAWLRKTSFRKESYLASPALKLYARIGTEDVRKDLTARLLKADKQRSYGLLVAIQENFPGHFLRLFEKKPSPLLGRRGLTRALYLALQKPGPRLIKAVIDSKLPRVSTEGYYKWLSSPTRVGRALILAAERKMPEYRKTMEELLRSKNHRERHLGRKMLHHYDPDRLHRELVKAAPDPPPDLSYSELLTRLAKMGRPEGFRVILEYQEDANEGQTLGLIDELAEARAPQAAQLALRWLKQGHKTAQDFETVLHALLKVDARKHLPSIRLLIRKCGLDDKDLAVIARHGVPELAQALEAQAKKYRGTEHGQRIEETMKALRTKKNGGKQQGVEGALK
jgi:hypothetical protein